MLADDVLAAYVFDHYNWQFAFLRPLVAEIVEAYLKLHGDADEAEAEAEAKTAKAEADAEAEAEGGAGKEGEEGGDGEEE